MDSKTRPDPAAEAAVPSKEPTEASHRMTRGERIELAVRALRPLVEKDQPNGWAPPASPETARPINIARLKATALNALRSQQADRERFQQGTVEPEPPTAMLVCSDAGCFSSFEECEQDPRKSAHTSNPANNLNDPPAAAETMTLLK